MKKLMLALIVLLVSQNILAGSGDIKSTLAAVRKQVEQGKAVTVNDQSIYSPQNELMVLASMQRWINEPNTAIRLQAVAITGRIAVLTSIRQCSKLSLDILFKACEDKDACVGAIALQYLKQVNWQYYMPTHKDTIRTFLGENQSSLEDYLYMAGYMYANNQMDTIHSLIQSGKLSEKQVWKAHLALARLGKRESIEECIKMANAVPFGEQYVTDILPGLVYTRQKACTNLLVDVLIKSDKVISAAKRNKMKLVSYHYSVIEALAGVIDGLPVKVGFGGELVTPTNEDAMQTAIKWFELNDNYRFKGEKRVVNPSSTINYAVLSSATN